MIYQDLERDIELKYFVFYLKYRCKKIDNYLRLLYNIPSGIELTAHVVTNYGQLKTIWHQRHNHKLPEWRKFCDWILTLPKFCDLTGIKKENENANN